MKIIDCSKVNPASGCGHVVEAETDEELMRRAAEHAKSHNVEFTPEMASQVRQFIETR
jgi:predicted small metal-binding protein